MHSKVSCLQNLFPPHKGDHPSSVFLRFLPRSLVSHPATALHFGQRQDSGNIGKKRCPSLGFCNANTRTVRFCLELRSVYFLCKSKGDNSQMFSTLIFAGVWQNLLAFTSFFFVCHPNRERNRAIKTNQPDCGMIIGAVPLTLNFIGTQDRKEEIQANSGIKHRLLVLLLKKKMQWLPVVINSQTHFSVSQFFFL